MKITHIVPISVSNPFEHGAVMAIAPLIIRWGPDASSDMLRACARCTVCGHRGATLQSPGWKNGHLELGRRALDETHPPPGQAITWFGFPGFGHTRTIGAAGH
jgi:hypothetical protein